MMTMWKNRTTYLDTYSSDQPHKRLRGNSLLQYLQFLPKLDLKENTKILVFDIAAEFLGQTAEGQRNLRRKLMKNEKDKLFKLSS